jgi:hypothetical protein
MLALVSSTCLDVSIQQFASPLSLRQSHNSGRCDPGLPPHGRLATHGGYISQGLVVYMEFGLTIVKYRAPCEFSISRGRSLGRPPSTALLSTTTRLCKSRSFSSGCSLCELIVVRGGYGLKGRDVSSPADFASRAALKAVCCSCERKLPKPAEAGTSAAIYVARLADVE